MGCPALDQDSKAVPCSGNIFHHLMTVGIGVSLKVAGGLVKNSEWWSQHKQQLWHKQLCSMNSLSVYLISFFSSQKRVLGLIRFCSSAESTCSAFTCQRSLEVTGLSLAQRMGCLLFKSITVPWGTCGFTHRRTQCDVCKGEGPFWDSLPSPQKEATKAEECWVFCSSGTPPCGSSVDSRRLCLCETSSQLTVFHSKCKAWKKNA